jgi:hypothetical protein
MMLLIRDKEKWCAAASSATGPILTTDRSSYLVTRIAPATAKPALAPPRPARPQPLTARSVLAYA